MSAAALEAIKVSPLSRNVEPTGVQTSAVPAVSPPVDPHSSAAPDRPGLATLATALPPPSSRDAITSRAALEGELLQLAWRGVAVQFDRVALIESFPSTSLGALNLSVELAPEATETLRARPDWSAYVNAQTALGNSVYWITVRAKINPPVGSATFASAAGHIDVRLTLPVSVSRQSSETPGLLSEAFAATLHSAIAHFPTSGARARALRGPWELLLANQQDLGGQARVSGTRIDLGFAREVLVRLTKPHDAARVDATRTEQVIPKGHMGERVELGDPNGLRVTLAGGETASLYRHARHAFALAWGGDDGGIDEAMTRLSTLRVPKAGAGVTRSERRTSTHAGHSEDVQLTLAYGSNLQLATSAKRERLSPTQAMVAEDQFRSRALRERDIDHVHLAFGAAPRIDASMTVGAGPLVVGGGASMSRSSYEEMIVEQPRSLIASLRAPISTALRVPHTAEQHLRHQAGEQFRSLHVKHDRVHTSVGKGFALGVGPVIAGRIETSAGHQRLVDFKRYVLPNGHVLVDRRAYDTQSAQLETMLEATVYLFGREDAEQLIRDHLAGRLVGPLAKLVTTHFGELGVVASHLRGLHHQSHETLIRAELDLNRPEHREVFELIRTGAVDEAAERLAALALRGSPVAYTAELGPRAPSGEQAHRSAVAIGPDNQIIVSYAGHTEMDPGYPDRLALGTRVGRWRFRPLHRDVERGHTQERATHTSATATGEPEVITLERDDRFLRVDRRILWSHDHTRFSLVTFRERARAGDPPGEWSEPTTYLVAEHESNEALSEANVRDLKAFADALGVSFTHASLRPGSLVATLLGARYGHGKLTGRLWMPLQAIEELAGAGDNDIFVAAFIASQHFGGDVTKPVPSWLADAQARALLIEWMRMPDAEPSTAKDFAALAFWRASGQQVWQLPDEDVAAVKTAVDLVALRDRLQGGLHPEAAAEAWRAFGEQFGFDYQHLAALRWAVLLRRDPSAAARRRGSDDLFFVDSLAVRSARAHLDGAVEEPLPSDAARMAEVLTRAARTYVIRSL